MYLHSTSLVRTIGLVLVVSAVTLSCTSASDTTVVDSQPTGPPSAEAGVAELESAGDVFAASPELAPAELREADLLADERGVGPATFDAPDLDGFTRVAVVMSCDGPGDYVVQLGSPADPAPVWTAGSDCRGPQFGTYTSPELNSSDDLSNIYVQAPVELEYFVTIYGLTSTS